MDEKTKLNREWYREVRARGKRNTPLLDKIWQHLDSNEVINQALNDPAETPLQILLRDSEPYIDGAEFLAQLSAPPLHGGGQEEEEEREEIRFQLGDFESERATAFEEHLARIAADEFRVRRYREKMLGGELLTPDQARVLINSPAGRVFSRRQFENRDIPLTDHAAKLKEIEEVRTGGRVGWRFTISVEPPGIERTIARRFRELPFIDEGGVAETITVGDGSVLGDLAELADRLAVNYPWEPKAETVHFVLTGEVPAVPPVKMYYSRKRKLNFDGAGGFRYGWITLEFAPWISTKTVEAAYSDAKRQVIGDRKYRRLEKKSLKMIRFIAGYEVLPKGRQLLEAWNATKGVQKNPD